jgi:hypothetical protein
MNTRFGTWYVRSLYRAGSLMKVAKEISKYQLHVVEVEVVRWDTGGTKPAGELTFFCGKENENYELGTIKIISITLPSVIKIYLYVYMPLHISVDNNHHQKANQLHKDIKIHQIRFHRILVKVTIKEYYYIYKFKKLNKLIEEQKITKDNNNQNNLSDIALGHEYTPTAHITGNKDINTPQNTPETSASSSIRKT